MRKKDFFQRTKVLGLLFISIFYLSFSNLSTLQADFLSSNALYLEFTDHFFHRFSQSLLNKDLEDIVKEPLEDIDDTYSGVNVEIEGMHYSVYFKSLDIQALEKQIQINVGIGDIHLYAHEVKLRKGWLRSTCRDTDIFVAESSQLHAIATFNPIIVDGHLDLSSYNIDFNIPESAYRVNGPKKCSGFLGSILESVIHNQLKKLRNKLAEKVRDQLHKQVPKFQDKLNKKIIIHKDLELDNPPLFPAAEIDITLFPAQMKLSAGMMSLSYSANFNVNFKDDSRNIDFMWSNNRMSHRNNYGFVGINPHFINTFFEAVFSQPMPFTELTEEHFDQIYRIFSWENFGQIIPDLLDIDINSNTEFSYLRPFVRLNKAPSIKLSEENNQVNIVLPGLQLLLQINTDGQWRDYYTFDILIKADTDFTFDEGTIKIGINPNYNIEVSGRWADSFPIKNPKVEHRMLQGILGDVLHILTVEKSTFEIGLPDLKIDGHPFTLSPQIKEPYIGFYIIDI